MDGEGWLFPDASPEQRPTWCGPTATEMLRDLLAVLHRDGGHYTSRYGLHKSWQDAMQKASELVTQ